MNNKSSKAWETSAESRSSTAHTPPIVPDAVRRPIEAALRIREHLIKHLLNVQNPKAEHLKFVEDDEVEIDPKWTAAVCVMAAKCAIADAEMVLWCPDLLEHAWSQADKFGDVSVSAVDLPQKSEFWCSYGPELMLGHHGDGHALCVQVLCSQNGDHFPPCLNGWLGVISFYFPIVNGSVRLDKPPIMKSFELDVGRPPTSDEERRLLACLSFRAQPFVNDSPADVHHSRGERRRMERENRTPPTVRVVNLRRNERTGKRVEGRQPTDHQCQFLVSAHVRRPNPRMREQYPIWVLPYIKGPKGAPFKPPTKKIIVVKR